MGKEYQAKIAKGNAADVIFAIKPILGLLSRNWHEMGQGLTANEPKSVY